MSGKLKNAVKSAPAQPEVAVRLNRAEPPGPAGTAADSPPSLPAGKEDAKQKGDAGTGKAGAECGLAASPPAKEKADKASSRPSGAQRFVDEWLTLITKHQGILGRMILIVLVLTIMAMEDTRAILRGLVSNQYFGCSAGVGAGASGVVVWSKRKRRRRETEHTVSQRAKTKAHDQDAPDRT
jgi:hypothetical protein